jgi:hypothetical protein
MANWSDDVFKVGAVIDAVAKLLPASWASKVAGARKGVVVAAGAVVTVASDVSGLVPVQDAGLVAAVVAVATAVVTYFTPNAKP